MRRGSDDEQARPAMQLNRESTNKVPRLCKECKPTKSLMFHSSTKELKLELIKNGHAS